MFNTVMSFVDFVLIVIRFPFTFASSSLSTYITYALVGSKLQRFPIRNIANTCMRTGGVRFFTSCIRNIWTTPNYIGDYKNPNSLFNFKICIVNYIGMF